MNLSSTIWIPTNHFSNGYFRIAILLFSPYVIETQRILQTNKNITFKIYGVDLAYIKSQIDFNIPSLLIIEFHWGHHAF